MDRIEVLVTGQGFSDLLDAVSVRIQNHNLELASAIRMAQQVTHQLLMVGCAGVDDDQLVRVEESGPSGWLAGLGM